MQREERFSRADRVITIGFWINAVLMIAKLSAGHFGQSEAVLADGVESGADFIALLATKIALRIGRRPCDSDHPYGHGKAESIAAIIVSVVILVTGCGILFRAVQSISRGSFEHPQVMAVITALVTILIKEGLFRYSRRVGNSLESPAVLALAKDHRKDALTSIGTLIGVTGGYLGAFIMDPLAAGLTSFFIFHIGFITFRSAAHELMDGQPSGEFIAEITLLAEAVPGVEHVHEIRARRSGQYLIVDLKLEMDPEMTVKQSHNIATLVKKGIFEKYANVGDVMIHINPHDESHEDLIRL